MSLFRTVAFAIVMFAGASMAGAAPISFVLEDSIAGTGIKIQNNAASLRFETQSVVMADDTPADSDGDFVPDVLDVEPLDPSVAIDATDLFFGHLGDATSGASGVAAFGQFFGNWIWMETLPGFPADLSTYANPFDAANRSGTTDDPFANAQLFTTGDASPWLALGGTVSGFLGGVFQTSDATAHQFWVELIVDVADGTLTVLSAGYDTDVYDPSPDVDLEPVPEPATWSLFAVGTAGLVVLHRRRRR